MLRSLLVVLACACCVSCDTPRSPPTAPPPPQANAPVIWRLVGRNHVITAYSGANGPTYSVTRPDGEVLVARGTLEELKTRDPDASRLIDSMYAYGIQAGM
jgi:hypothetical protein